MRHILPAVIAGLILLCPGHSGLAQTSDGPGFDQATPQPPAEPALLVADQVFITADRQLVAEGNVEAYQGEVRLRARKITFDRATGQLSIEGPIRIDQGGSVTILADAAELDDGMQNGLLQGARMVFEQQVQLAAAQMTRVGGRYTQLYKTSATSCQVCEDGRPPLWQIRAQKITHDQLERQLYFENAQLRILDVPVFYFPALRLPDPTLERATGFLVPSIRSTSQLETGVKVPYFFKLGDHRDLTLTPYLSPRTRTLEYRYRQAFKNGRIVIEGAHTDDDLIPDEDRGYIFAGGAFSVWNGYRLTFDLKAVSDDAYLADYGLPDLDRLRSEVALEKIMRDTAFRVGFIHYKTLRESEDQDEIPSRIFDVNYQRRFFPAMIGGEVRLSLNGHGHQRTSTENIVGRDVASATLDAEWLRSWVFRNGLRADWQIGAAADEFRVWDDDTFPSEVTRITPRTAFTLRYPMSQVTATGVTHYLEPIAQVGWTNVSDSDVPNDESQFVEFDQGNLLSLSRFPADDQRENATTGVLGLNWSMYHPQGWQTFATLGAVFRDPADPRFSKTSGLDGVTSDLLMAGQIRSDDGWSVTGRALLNGEINFDKVELRGNWLAERGGLSGTYVWLGRDPQEDRDQAVSEIWLNGRYLVSRNWTTRADIRYDINDSRAINAGFGLAYQNECVTVNFSVRRRFTETSSIEPTTDFGFTVALTGYAVEGGNKKYRRTCT